MQEMRVPSLGQEDPLERGMATHSSILAWRIPMDRGAWWATVHGLAKESDTAERLKTTIIMWDRQCYLNLRMTHSRVRSQSVISIYCD